MIDYNDEIDFIFTPKSKIYWRGNKYYKDNNTEFFEQVAPFPSQPDILVSGNVFCGLTYYVGEKYANYVEEWVNKISLPNVRFIDARYTAHYEYNQSWGTPYFLEINWSSLSPDRAIFAALCGDSWYYTRKDNPKCIVDIKYAVGINFFPVQETADECGLKLPS